ncbi:MAG: hypothetical protein J0H74_03930 [Chitinophagaceae bacterium]|nr:hypothetical protein [Chitinophagaceae bacterium]
MKTIRHKFVEFIPEQLEEGILYITVEYRTAVHRCVCGCGNKVVTPLSPTDWKMIFDGKTVSLYPSIGNWSFDCKSHYFITRNEIRHCAPWTKEAAERGRKKSNKLKKKPFAKLVGNFSKKKDRK